MGRAILTIYVTGDISVRMVPAVEQLLLKGYLYEVDEELRIPPRP
jgi:hypothetical protein